MRSRVAEALGKIGDKRAVDKLVVVLKDSSSNVRSLAVEALSKIGDARVV